MTSLARVTRTAPKNSGEPGPPDLVTRSPSSPSRGRGATAWENVRYPSPLTAPERAQNFLRVEVFGPEHGARLGRRRCPAAPTPCSATQARPLHVAAPSSLRARAREGGKQLSCLAGAEWAGSWGLLLWTQGGACARRVWGHAGPSRLALRRRHRTEPHRSSWHGIGQASGGEQPVGGMRASQPVARPLACADTMARLQRVPAPNNVSTSGPAFVVSGTPFRSASIERFNLSIGRLFDSEFVTGRTDSCAYWTTFCSAAIERSTPSTASTSGPAVVSGLDQTRRRTIGDNGRQVIDIRSRVPEYYEDLALMNDSVHSAPPWQSPTLHSAGQIPPPVPMVLEPSPSFVSPSNPSTAKVCQS